MSLYALDAVEDAIATTRSFLFPFDLRRWAKLALLMFFLGSGGGANPMQFVNGSSSWPASDWPTPGGGGPTPQPGSLPSIGSFEIAVIAAVLLFVLLLGLVFAYVGAVFEFVFLESLRRRQVAIRAYWREFRPLGRRLFGFRLVVGLAFLLVAAVLVGIVVVPYLAGTGRLSLGLLAVVLPLLALLAVVVGLVQGFTTEFVVPIMALEDRGVLDAWRAFWPTLTDQWKQFAAYVGMRFVLQIAASILMGLVVGFSMLLLAIPFVVLGVVGYVLLSGQAIVGGAIIAFAVGLFVLSAVVLSLFAAVPVGTYFRYYALLVLGDTNEAFDAIPDQRAAVRE